VPPTEGQGPPASARHGASLDPDFLHEEAARLTGLDDFGADLSYVTPLRVFLSSIEQADRGPTYEQAGHDKVLHVLTTRLHFVAHAKEHPDVLDGRVERPVILIGLPRTGTTILYDLLALDPASRSPYEWEVQVPWPPPERATFADDARIAMVQEGLEAFFAAEPTFLSMHAMGASYPAECNTIMEYHFAGPDFWSSFGVPEYTHWVATERAVGMYDTHRHFLQHLQWHGPQGRWTLKSPGHLLDLEGLLDTYPDACLVWTHRDPTMIMASLSSLITPGRRYAGGETDPTAIGASTVHLWTNTMSRGVTSRERDLRVEQAVIDIAFRDFVADQIGTVERIHQHFGLPTSEEHVRRMEEFLRTHQRGAHGGHDYSLEYFGLDEGEVRSQFAAYTDRFAAFL